MSATDTAPRRIGDVMKPTKEPSPGEAAIVAEVHALAAAFAELPAEKRPGFLVEVRKLTTGFDRFRATVHTPPGHPMFGPLMAMLDGLIATDQLVVVTSGGIFDRSELASASASVSPSKVTFPVSVKGGEAIYPTAQTAGPNIVPFRAIRPEEVKRAPSMWGDD
jgi:hypothetical protein